MLDGLDVLDVLDVLDGLDGLDVLDVLDGLDDDGAALAEPLEPPEPPAPGEPVEVAVGDAVGEAVDTLPSPPRVRTNAAPRTPTATTTPVRTQKPRSGVGTPVPGSVCRPTPRRYRVVGRRLRT